LLEYSVKDLIPFPLSPIIYNTTSYIVDFD